MPPHSLRQLPAANDGGDALTIRPLTCAYFVTVTVDVKTIQKASQRADGTPIPPSGR